ncbi:enoyl-CoA hydratase/isomerase family protein [Aeromicrobium sp. CnD17-E]|uniref:enoyl-CoA hydratase/isomerase family protein n=1 Tax=Aeromicrobium sp. CnD17-E TaxID=2954487 RepID=UPI0020970ED2|nr:enoyl-CoA hydratase-related protein [Aeromicrobium sp. CnD17-E]MCO7240570.1 enoyl-CoA hydratase-related protein [Aeromicrobium sp. CnD17-E]
MTDAPVLLAVDAGVAHVELNRPDASNTIDLPFTAAFADVLTQVRDDDAVRVVLLTGRGRMFCAGGDLGAMDAAPDRSAFLQELADALHDGVRLLDGLEKPVVVGVQGAAAGAGLSLVLGGDLVVAGRSAAFVTAYTSVGLTPDGGQSWLLPRVVGLQRALELTLTPRRLSAEEAREWGIVTRVVDDEAVADEALALARRLADGPARAFGRARRLVRGSFETPLSDQLDREARSIATSVAEPESAELIGRFLSRGR